MSTLTKLFELAYSGNSDKKRIIESLPKELSYVQDGNVIEIKRELLLTESVESTTLIQTQVYNTIIQGAEPFKCFRDVLPIIPTRSNSLRVNIGETGSYAGKVAEGAEIPIEDQAYTPRTFTIDKFGVRPVISKEMIEDGLFNVVELELMKAGMKMENKLNQDALTIMLDSAGNEYDGNGSVFGIRSLIKAVGLNAADGFKADKIVMSPEFYTYCQLDSLPTTGAAPNVLAEQSLRTNIVPSYMGLGVYQCGVADASATYTWEYNSDSDIGAIVLDSANAGAIAMNRDIKVAEYDDPIRDLVGMSVTMRYGMNYFNANAICRIEY